MRLFRHAVPLALLALPAAAHALGLGRVVGEAVLGESLQLEVPLTGSMDRPLEGECIILRRPPDTIDTEYFPRDLTARIDRQSGVPRLLLSTRSALRQPLVEFRVSVSCGYNLSHDYLLMVSPRIERAQSGVAPVAQADAPARSAVPAVQAQPATAESPVIAAPSAGLPDGLPAKTVVLDKDMTLEQLARRHFPGPLRQERFMRWVIEANPQYFAGTGKLRQQRLQSGLQLLIPDGVPPRRPDDYKHGKSPLGEPMAAAQPDAPAAKPARKATGPAVETPPTRSATDGRKDRLVVGGSGGRDLKLTMALVERMTGVMEQQASAQTANNEKIQQLEATVADLGKYVAKLEAEAQQRDAQWQAERQAEKQARQQEVERGWTQLLLAVVAGGVLGAGLLLGGRLLSARKQNAVTDLGGSPIGQPAGDAAADNESGPLTEFGWDDDPRHISSPARAPAATPAVAATATVPPPTPAALAAMPAAPPARTIEFEPPLSTGKDSKQSPTSHSHDQKPDDPAAAAIELANIMTSMGLAESAAQTLVEHIRENPRQSLGHWLKLLELHRLNGNRTEFERSANEMRQHFNVQ
ncbi:MAG TPA: hypothetical protein VFF82_00405, partial [Rhodocyclaceae bacterium]|nr:hypothetical protein [Rhodocyclaceae bacterium]